MSAVPEMRDHLITGEELLHMPGVGPCELIDGRIVPMSPTGGEHGRVEGNVYLALRTFVTANGLGKVLVGEVGIYTRRNPDSVRGADVVFIAQERYARSTNPAGFLDIAPELIVEILSPRDTVMDLDEKLREYFAIGVSLVWVVDPRSRSVSAYRSLSSIQRFQHADRLTAADVLPGFEVTVASLFEE